MIARTLTEQRDVGQVADQWLLLGGTAGILYHRGRVQLAHDTLRGCWTVSGLAASPRPRSISRRCSAAQLMKQGSPPTGPLTSRDLVDRTLAAIDEVLDERTL